MMGCFGCLSVKEGDPHRVSDEPRLEATTHDDLDDAASDVASEDSFHSCHDHHHELEEYHIAVDVPHSGHMHGHMKQKSSCFDKADSKTSKRLEQHLQSLDNESGWLNASKGGDKGLELFYQHEKDSTIHSFRGRCTLDCPMSHVLCIAREFDLSGGKEGWNQFALESLVLKEFSSFSILAYALLWLPWPLKNISLCASARGYDLFNEKDCLLIEIDAGEDLLEAEPKSYEKSWKVKVCNGLPGSFIWFKALGKQKTRVCITISLDAGIKSVPQSLVAFVLNILAPFIYRAIVQLVAQAFATPPSSKMAERLQRRLEERQGLYPRIDSRVEEYLDRMATSSAAINSGQRVTKEERSRE
jgi:hypothetical protein